MGQFFKVVCVLLIFAEVEILLKIRLTTVGLRFNEIGVTKKCQVWSGFGGNSNFLFAKTSIAKIANAAMPMDKNMIPLFISAVVVAPK
jgi:hypothetical protein